MQDILTRYNILCLQYKQLLKKYNDLLSRFELMRSFYEENI